MIRQIIEERVYSGLQNQKVRVHNGTGSKQQSQQLNLEAETSHLKSQIEVKRVHLEWHVAFGNSYPALGDTLPPLWSHF